MKMITRFAYNVLNVVRNSEVPLTLEQVTDKVYLNSNPQNIKGRRSHVARVLSNFFSEGRVKREGLTSLYVKV